MGDIVESDEVEAVAKEAEIELAPGEAKEVAQVVEEQLDDMIRDAILAELKDRHG